MRGIVLIAVGSDGYAKWAINMAASIKFYSPDLYIQIITSKDLFAQLHACGLFDIITVIEESAYRSETGALFPAKLKTKLYDYIEFEEAIYLDVDGILIKDITPVFETKSDFACDVQGVYDLSQGELFYHMKWCKPDVVWFYYGLGAKDRMPAVNSSFLFIRKGELTKNIFEKAHENLMTNPIPTDKHWYVWGKQKSSKVCQPDELYINVALAQLGIIPEHLVAVYFRMITDYGNTLSVEKVRENHYAIGLFGQHRTNHLSVREMYNKEMKRIADAMKIQYWKGDILGKTKFVIS